MSRQFIQQQTKEQQTTEIIIGQLREKHNFRVNFKQLKSSISHIIYYQL